VVTSLSFVIGSCQKHQTESAASLSPSLAVERTNHHHHASLTPITITTLAFIILLTTIITGITTAGRSP